MDTEDADWYDDDNIGSQYRIQDVLDGTTSAGLSHEGGEVAELMRYYLAHRSKQRYVCLLPSSPPCK